MVEKTKFRHEKSIEGLKNKLKNRDFENKTIFNFLNQNDLYNLKKNPVFRESLSLKNSVNFIDGFVISAALSIKKLKRVRRMIGPNFTYEILREPEISNRGKHFFIGLNSEDLDKLSKEYGINRENMTSYNPPFIRELQFPKEHVDKIAERINLFNPDFLWVGIGSPKQNILVKDLYEKIKVKKILKLNVGAALDFALNKKKPAPKAIRILGIEWLYRFVTDFKKTKKKAWRSLVAVKYALTSIDLEDRDRVRK